MKQKCFYMVGEEKSEVLLKGVIFTRKQVFKIVQDAINITTRHANNMIEQEGQFRKWKNYNVLQEYLEKVHIK